MTWTWRDLVLYTGGVYGIAWLVARSHLLAGVRARLAPVPVLGRLAQCIVCTSGWVCIAWMLLGTPGLLSAGFAVATPTDAALLMGWTLASTWGLARLLGDAE